MTAQWAGGGSTAPPPPARLKPPPGPPYREWRLAGLEFRRSRRQGRWACQTSDGSGLKMCGVAGARTPLGALWSVLRMLREA